jgi:hypothetical protein
MGSQLYCFQPEARQNTTEESDLWIRVAHLMAARKQRERDRQTDRNATHIQGVSFPLS